MFSSVTKKLYSHLGQSGYIKQRVAILNSINNIDTVKKNQLKKLVRSGKSVMGYIPYVAGQTELVIFNFFAVNYGVRSKSTAVISLTDENFKPIRTITLDLSFREHIVHKIDSEFTAIFCTVLLVSERIIRNHGSHGGHLRFWGAWNDFSAFTHSMPIPPAWHLLFRSPALSFLREKFLRKKRLGDRRFFPSESKSANHFSPMNGAMSVTDRGDLSSQLELELGFLLLRSEDSRICACFHNSPYTRDSINTHTKSDHIVALPDIPSIDAHLYFGECCKPGARFLISLFRSDMEFDPLEEAEFEVAEFESVKISSLFPTQTIIGKTPCWLRLRPISGLHREYYVNIIYSENNASKLFDGVHSHSFASKNSGRSLKFAPFKISDFTDHFQERERFFCSSLVIWGHKTQETRYRLRIFSDSDRNFEVIFHGSIKAETVKFVDLKNLLGSSRPKFEFLIVQLESEEANLNASLFSWSHLRDSSLESVCVDHLTGG